ncbi:L-aminoadipate-semialdehyde dehydrogenase [Mycena venus]|uniref:L-aminoadipate-semialdehyde dehydrogenase n=1 Tax=Mycena venus TaxID=2733690 RepID=A0A8H6XSV5_9AGAR|nr:L-aminoadipate-semialdehyde dehydrogenase [Mycena venus]
MSLDLQVPEELLLEIVQHLPKETLQYVSLAHRTLRHISRPFLFADFVFHPYGMRYMPADRSRVRWPEADDPMCLHDEAQDHEVERLKFWSSSGIAPFVRSCSIIPLNSRDWAEQKAADTPTALLDIFFERLPHFAGIHHFHAYMVHFTQIGLANLCGLPRLTRLQIIQCRSPEPLDCSSLELPRIRAFELQHVLYYKPALDLWMRLLRRGQLAEVDLAFAPVCLTRIAQNLPVFSHANKLTLRSLRVGDNLMPPALPSVLPILRKFPNATNFVMEGRWGEKG